MQVNTCIKSLIKITMYFHIRVFIPRNTEQYLIRYALSPPPSLRFSFFKHHKLNNMFDICLNIVFNCSCTQPGEKHEQIQIALLPSLFYQNPSCNFVERDGSGSSIRVCRRLLHLVSCKRCQINGSPRSEP